jgi:integrase
VNFGSHGAKAVTSRCRDSCAASWRSRSPAKAPKITGLRWGELAALRVANVDLLRGRLYITAAVTEIGGVADLRALQRLVGHRSATTTLDVYGDVLDQTVDSVADRLDEAYTAGSVSSRSPDVSSTMLPMPRSDR